MGKPNSEDYKKSLMNLKSKIINSGVLSSSQDLHVSTEDLSDEADLATNVINQTVSFNIRNRELGKLRMIEDALRRIETGSYGRCEECDEPIGEKRLKHQPWATHCIAHAEERERETKRFSKIG
jgi:DnaK suppressor protein